MTTTQDRSNSAPLRLSDRILPDQPFNRLYFSDPPEQYYSSLYSVLARASHSLPPQESFDLETTDVVSVEEMASNPVMLSFLDLMVRLVGARRVLEIGSFIGVSAMTMARALPPGGKVTTLEKFDHFASLCRRNFERNGLSDRIELIEGDAKDLLENYTPDAPIDLAFIDGNKELYLDHFLAVEPHVRPGGLIIVDDVLFQGDVLNSTPNTEKGRGVLRFLQYAETQLGWKQVALPVSDGVMLLLKPLDAMSADAGNAAHA